MNAGEVPVYFLHGALHLVVGATGVTRKLRRNLIQNVLDQFGQPIPGDPRARPLLVTEGSARDKLRAIEANDHLTHALGRLRALDLPVVVFGSSLSAEDLAAKQSDIFGRLRAEELIFFDSTTHPLGSPGLSVG